MFLEVLGEAALGRAQLARAVQLLGAAAIERGAIGAPVPLDGPRFERIVTALTAHRAPAPAEGTVSAVVTAAELRGAPAPPEHPASQTPGA